MEEDGTLFNILFMNPGHMSKPGREKSSFLEQDKGARNFQKMSAKKILSSNDYNTKAELSYCLQVEHSYEENVFK